MKYPYEQDKMDLIISELTQLNTQLRIMNNLLLDISRALKELRKVVQ